MNCLRGLKVSSFVFGLIFVVCCLLDLAGTTKFILDSKEFSRPLQINMAYQVMFLIACLPFFIGVIFEAKEPITFFLIVGPYSLVVTFLVSDVGNSLIAQASALLMFDRGGDSVIYGYHCGPSEVFYHESANTNSGLPPPADPMGLVQLKAKRRLERDHAIILL
ncbi:hypothetical protein NQ317_012822 [Molorchus minor]|uniref:Uncharacterized protein n=1 Tax=Molorchus minor TaxID=1323400 RepID=A0ABQ9K4A4_9CUCU|nr:hypothetical protein NQ317_012822 [Molorchus minor]